MGGGGGGGGGKGDDICWWQNAKGGNDVMVGLYRPWLCLESPRRHSSLLVYESISVEKSRWQESEGAGHFAGTVKKQKVMNH